MGYLNNATITVDAILTKKGRELLSKGQSQFNITQFAVADDEVDYSLYTTAHPLGSAYYGSLIENMPVLEASPDETQSMRYKLFSDTTGRGQRKTIPLISMQDAYILQYNSNETISPSTTDELSSGGYTAILFDGTIANLNTSSPLSTSTTTPFFSRGETSANAVVVQGYSFNLTAQDITVERTTQLTIVNNLTGATKTATITVKPKPTNL